MASPKEHGFTAIDFAQSSTFHGVLPLEPKDDVVGLFLRSIPNIIQQAADTAGSLDIYTVRPGHGNLAVDPRNEQTTKALLSPDPLADESYESRKFYRQTDMLRAMANGGFTLASIQYALSAAQLATFSIALHDQPNRPELYEITGVRDEDDIFDEKFLYEFNEYDTTIDRGRLYHALIDTATALELVQGAARCAGLREEEPPIEAILEHIFNSAEKKTLKRGFTAETTDASMIDGEIDHTLTLTYRNGKPAPRRTLNSYRAVVERQWPNRKDIATKLTLSKDSRKPATLEITGNIQNGDTPGTRSNDFNDIYTFLFENPAIALDIITSAFKRLPK